MSNYGPYIQFLCCIVCHTSSVSGLVGAVSMCLCLLLTRSYPVGEFGFSLCPIAVRWWPHNQSLNGEGDSLHVGSISGLSLDWK